MKPLITLGDKDGIVPKKAFPILSFLGSESNIFAARGSVGQEHLELLSDVCLHNCSDYGTNMKAELKESRMTLFPACILEIGEFFS